MKTKFRSIESGKLVTMWPTTVHFQSSYGLPVWVDKDNWCYGQCDLWPVPFGFVRIGGNVSPEYILDCRQIYGRRIKTIREQKGLSQQDLADRVGISRTTINKIEKGIWNFGIDTITAISANLDFFTYFFQKGEESDL